MAMEDEILKTMRKLMEGTVDELVRQGKESAPPAVCSACARMPSKLRACGGRCGGAARYCNNECARAHWP